LSIDHHYHGCVGPPKALSLEHDRELGCSGISEAVKAARGYYTARSRSEVPEAFANWQRRLGLVVPIHSPDGETVSHQLKPRRRILRKSGEGPKYETAAGSETILDVNPLMIEKVRTGIEELWVTEGAKKVDALASWGEPAVGIVGVWNIAVPGTKGETPLPCWSHVRLYRRRVVVVFDADTRTNPHVQEALRRAVRMLERLGAMVLVVYLPAVNGDGKAGVDDYLTAGGTVAELRVMAAPFKPVDVGRERMGRDRDLAAAVDMAWEHWLRADWRRFVGAAEGPHWKRGHTVRDVEKGLIKLGARGGRATDRGIHITVGVRTIALAAAKGKPATMRALSHLEAAGRLEVHESPGGRASRSYTLLLPAGAAGRAHRYHEGRGNTEAEQATYELQGYGHRGNGLRSPHTVPAGRWSVPGRKSRRGLDKVTRRVRDNAQPSTPGQWRLEPHRIAAVDWAYAVGGGMVDEEMAAALGIRRVRDYRRRVKAWLVDAGIFCEDTVESRLGVEWLEALNREREISGEIAAHRRDVTRYARERDGHRAYLADKNRPDTHYVNAGADGHIEDLYSADASEETAEQEAPVSSLAAAIRAYLECNPAAVREHGLGALPGWLAGTLWAYELYPGHPTPADVREAIAELGGERYLGDRLRAATPRREEYAA
jgi:hypothetical protein